MKKNLKDINADGKQTDKMLLHLLALQCVMSRSSAHIATKLLQVQLYKMTHM